MGNITNITFGLDSSYDLETDTGRITISLTKVGDMFRSVPRKGEKLPDDFQSSREELMKELAREVLRAWLHADICVC